MIAPPGQGQAKAGSGPNKHVYEYLDYYTGLECPMACVLITGAWGSGKTWLISDYFKSRRQEYLYVSLYGAQDADEIAQRLFVAMHPVLASKGVAIAGRIVKGLVKGAFKIDLDGDSKADMTLNPQLPGIAEAADIAKAAQRFRGKTIVLDDLERCDAAPHDTWGLLNRLVEQDHARVVVIANEEEIKDEQHHETKEKNVGMTLRVAPNIAEVVPSFIRSASSPLCSPADQVVLDVVHASGHENLRVIRSAVRDLARILDALDPEHARNTEAVSMLTRTTLAFALEVYMGKVKARSIERVAMSRYFLDDSTDGEEDEDTAVREAFSKYKTVSDLAPAPSNEWWADFFERGTFDTVELNAAIKERYDTNMPNWKRLSAPALLRDEEFEQLLSATLDELTRGEYRAVGQILSVMGMHFWAVKHGLSSHNEDELVAAATAALRRLDAEEFFVGYDPDWEDHQFDAWGGSYYQARDTDGFRALRAKAVERQEELLASSIGQKAEDLVSCLESGDVDAFSRALDRGREELSALDWVVAHRKVLHLIDPKRFADAVVRLEPRGPHTVAGCLHRRSMGEEERTWLEAVIGHIGEEPGLQRMIAKGRLQAALDR